MESTTEITMHVVPKKDFLDISKQMLQNSVNISKDKFLEYWQWWSPKINSIIDIVIKLSVSKELPQSNNGSSE